MQVDEQSIVRHEETYNALLYLCRYSQQACPDARDGDRDKFESQQKQVSIIILSAPGDHALHVVATFVGFPEEMMKKLDARYDSKSTSSKISMMVEHISVRYTNPRADITKHIDRLAANQGLICQTVGE